MELALIGSAALNALNICEVKTNDLDIIGTYNDVVSFMKNNYVIKKHPGRNGQKLFGQLSNNIMIEAEIAWDNSPSKQLFELIKNDAKTQVRIKNDVTFLYPSLNILYMLKMSHRYLKNSPHFLKTLQDIHLMEYFGAEIEKGHKEFYKLRENETYAYNHPNLNTSKNNFFTDVYQYEHDSIHMAIKHLDKPAYDYFKPDNNEVFCSKDLFFQCDELIRLYAVLEETTVLALERSQIPANFKIDRKKSFEMALEKVCTSITSGWFREYAWVNYYKIKSMYEDNYVEKFNEGLRNGTIVVRRD